MSIAPITNHFRTKLANLTYVSGSASTDLIDSSFTAVALPATESALYKFLFPTSVSSPSNRTAIFDYVNAYTMLLHSFSLDDVFTVYSPTITYTLDSLYSFEYNLVNLVQVGNQVINNPVVDILLSDKLNLRYDNMYKNAVPRMERLAGLVAAYSYRLG